MLVSQKKNCDLIFKYRYLIIYKINLVTAKAGMLDDVRKLPLDSFFTKHPITLAQLFVQEQFLILFHPAKSFYKLYLR